MIETKEVSAAQANTEYASETYLDALESFGWQKTQETSRRSGRVHHQYFILARETTVEQYNEFRRLENLYEETKVQLKTYDKASFGTAFLLLLLFLIPGILYIVYKTTRKNSILQHNDYCYKTMHECVLQAKNLK